MKLNKKLEPIKKQIVGKFQELILEDGTVQKRLEINFSSNFW